jgi:hypothetical protein
MVSISAALARIKDDSAAYLQLAALEQICREAGLKWRRRVLEPATTILIFVLQLLHRNTAIAHLPRIAGRAFTPGAYCLARQRLPLAVLRRLLRESGAPLRCRATQAADGRWHGHRIFLVDGSSCSMPDTAALQKRFGQPGGQRHGCGFPVAHLLLLIEAHSGLIVDVVIAPLRTHDLSGAADLHAGLQPEDVLVGDRGFCSFGHVAALQQRRVYAVFRAHQRLKIEFGPSRCAAPSRKQRDRLALQSVAQLGPGDRLAFWRKPKTCARTMTPAEHAALPDYLLVRLLEYRIAHAGYRTRQVQLLTTLVDPQRYSATDLAALYGLRWQVETNLRHLKQTLGLDVLHSKTPAGIEKEIVMFILVYNLVRGVMLAEARRCRVRPDRISFIDVLRALAWPILGADPPLRINPERPGRVQPRVRKRRPKQYPLMQEPRDVLKKRLLKSEIA